MPPNTLLLGLDVGSTTVKAVVLDHSGTIIFTRYIRHHSAVKDTTIALLHEVHEHFPDATWKIGTTGSGAIALTEQYALPFVQEVLASSISIRNKIPHADVAIELGGEDAKMTFFQGGIDQRMNETCAGGTGAFIDQMAAFIQTDAAGLDALALQHQTIYPIASRCGVFAKTDILALLNQGSSREDIAASIMQAVVNQTVSGLARGRSINGTVVFLGGPLTFLPSLRQRFISTLNLQPGQALFPDHAEFFIALGAALSAQHDLHNHWELKPLIDRMESAAPPEAGYRLPPLFSSPEEKHSFFARHTRDLVERLPLEQATGQAWLGFDSGSTTIKAALINANGCLLYSSYSSHLGNPLQAAIAILKDIYSKKNPALTISGTTVTGYGSALLTAALKADIDEVETVAHLTAAQFFEPKVDFILDIGGQDIKCLFVRDGTIDQIYLNEACSAGCGSFIENFATSLGMSLEDFVTASLQSQSPVDLGTRCTVFMNSKVKQAQKEGARVEDIAAGLCYAVVRNACYKVLKISNTEALGVRIVVQGGAFINNALLRALELELGRHTLRPDIPGLMGAFGAALIAKERVLPKYTSQLLSQQELERFSAETATTRCKQCSNHCLLTITTFADKRRFISGNRCERGADAPPQNLPNLYRYKYQLLFEQYTPLEKQQTWRGTIGIPRALNMYENYPLWFTLFTQLGYRIELSSPSSKELFFQGYETIPSQTVCYPAKLAHGHIIDLIKRGVDAIFFPCIAFEQKDFPNQVNTFNCPVVIGYPELLANNITLLREKKLPIIHEFLPLSRSVLAKRLRNIPFFNHIPVAEVEEAVQKAFAEMDAFKQRILDAGQQALHELNKANKFGIILAGHPYHVDPAVHHGIADLITSCGMGVLTEDSVASLAPDPGPLRVVDQWTYHARLYRAGAFASRTENLAILQLVSFGCGLDAITADQLQEIVASQGRLYAQIKIDEGTNLGPAKIRIRSLHAALQERSGAPKMKPPQAPPPQPIFTEQMRKTHTLLIPQLSPIHFQFMETVFEAHGYKAKQLPSVNREAIDLGLRYVNNDACFPAIVVVGQLLQAIKSGQFDLDKIALLISETGGGCRATNYIALLRKALQDANLGTIPIVSFFMSSGERGNALHLSGTMLRRIIMAGCYGDALMRVLHRVRPYEAVPGSTDRLASQWAEQGKKCIASGNILRFDWTMLRMIRAFDRLPLSTETRKPLVGLVGEILLKYHPDANNEAAKVIEQEGGEAVVPDLMDFILYSYYDEVFNYRYLSGSWKECLNSLISIRWLELCRLTMRLGFRFSKRFTAPIRFKQLRAKTKGLISLGHQTGEGWLLTAEMVKLLESGVPNILCMQPFGCLPNHITGKGLLKELKLRFPYSNIMAVDYDPGASEVNQINRIKLMMASAKELAAQSQCASSPLVAGAKEIFCNKQKS